MVPVCQSLQSELRDTLLLKWRVEAKEGVVVFSCLRFHHSICKTSNGKCRLYENKRDICRPQIRKVTEALLLKNSDRMSIWYMMWNQSSLDWFSIYNVLTRQQYGCHLGEYWVSNNKMWSVYFLKSLPVFCLLTTEFNLTSFCREVGPLSYSRMKILRLDGNKMSYQQLPSDWVFCLRVLESIYIWPCPKLGLLYVTGHPHLVIQRKKNDSSWDFCFDSQLFLCELK